MATSNQPNRDCPWADVPATGPILRPAQAAEYVGLSLPGYYERAKVGDLPTPMKIGLRASGIPRPHLDAVIAAWAAKAELAA